VIETRYHVVVSVDDLGRANPGYFEWEEVEKLYLDQVHKLPTDGNVDAETNSYDNSLTAICEDPEDAQQVEDLAFELIEKHCPMKETP
jgi:hypothetical protein